MKTDAHDAAYPIINGDYNPEFGLTKREYFAAMAMQGILSDRDNQGYTWNYEAMAADAVKMADQLIKQLNQIK